MNDAERIYELVRWWEKRRWIYNLVMLLVVGWSTWSIYSTYICLYPIRFAFEVVIYGVIANLAYTLGWIVPIGVASFRRTVDELGSGRQFLFIFGLLFSLLVTFGYLAVSALNFSAQF